MLEVAVACGRPGYRRAHLTTNDSAKLLELLKVKSGQTWEALAQELDSDAFNLMHCASGRRDLSAHKVRSFVQVGIERSWLTPDEGNSFTGALSSAQSQIESENHETAVLQKFICILTKDLGLSSEQAHRSARQMLLDTKMVLCDEQMLFDRLAYLDPDECAATKPAPRSTSSPRLPSL